MRHTPTVLFLISALVLPLGAQTSFIQSFNNNNGSFTDSQSALYNWSSRTAAGVATVVNDVSAGNTSPSPLLPGEATQGRGFMFVVPATGTDVPGATLHFTTHLGVSLELQNNPQPDWFATSAGEALSGLRLGGIESIGVRSSGGSATGITTHVGLQLDGSTWVFAATPFALTGSMAEFSITNLVGLNWYTGVFDGTTLSSSITSAPTVTLTGNELVTGYAYYGNTGSLAGNASRVRLDRFVVTTPIPEPSTLGMLALGVVSVTIAAARRRR